MAGLLRPAKFVDNPVFYALLNLEHLGSWHAMYEQLIGGHPFSCHDVDFRQPSRNLFHDIDSLIGHLNGIRLTKPDFQVNQIHLQQILFGVSLRGNQPPHVLFCRFSDANCAFNAASSAPRSTPVCPPETIFATYMLQSSAFLQFFSKGIGNLNHHTITKGRLYAYARKELLAHCLLV